MSKLFDQFQLDPNRPVFRAKGLKGNNLKKDISKRITVESLRIEVEMSPEIRDQAAVNHIKVEE